MDIVAVVLAGRVAAAKQCRSALSLSLSLSLFLSSHKTRYEPMSISGVAVDVSRIAATL